MESRIPLPTDNVFKFYAMFGLLLLVFSIASSIYLMNMRLDSEIHVATELAEMRVGGESTEKINMLLVILEKEFDSKLVFITWTTRALTAIGMVGIFLMTYGFRKWHCEIQPLQDELLRLTVKKMAQDVERVKATNEEV